MRGGDKLGGVRWLLGTEFPGLSCEAKYLLVRVWLWFGIEPIEEEITVLRKRFGMSVEAFLKARNELLSGPGSRDSTGYLVERSNDERLDWRGTFTPGRPIRAFRLERAFGEEIADMVSPPGTAVNDHYVTAALLYRTAKIGKKSESAGESQKGNLRQKLRPRLAIQGKLLLAILWCLADRHGVVADAGFRRLSRLAGVSPGRVRNQLARLEELGFFMLRIPGLTGRFVPGKVPSALVLRRDVMGRTDASLKKITLAWGKLSPIGDIHRRSDHILIRKNTPARGRVNHDGSDFWIEAEASAYPGPIRHQQEEKDEDKAPPLYSAFAGEPRRAEIREYLLFKACDYVTWLINEHPTKLHDWERGEGKEPDAAGALLKRVERDLLSNGQLRERYRGARVLLARWFCIHIWRRAQEVIGVMAENEEVSAESVTENIGSRYSDILLMPVRGKTVHFLTYDCREQTD